MWGWHPLTKVELADEMVRSGGSGGAAMAAARLVLTTPIKLFASVGGGGPALGFGVAVDAEAIAALALPRKLTPT